MKDSYTIVVAKISPTSCGAWGKASWTSLGDAGEMTTCLCPPPEVGDSEKTDDDEKTYKRMSALGGPEPSSRWREGGIRPMHNSVVTREAHYIPLYLDARPPSLHAILPTSWRHNRCQCDGRFTWKALSHLGGTLICWGTRWRSPRGCLMPAYELSPS
jgi:hypothetical protein